ncbi:MAG TPA: CrcB family protein [Ktedonobacterales bacterium]|nr:CrcB family protein [Ktedonobacterales bacterium]
MIRKLSLVLAGGFCGTVVRYLLSKPLLALAGVLPDAHAGFPYDILLINLTGAFVIGLLFGAFEHGASLSPDARLTLGTGFLGSYTTFSSFMVGAGTMLARGQYTLALLYLCGAMAAGVTLAMAGYAVSGAVIERQRAARVSAFERLLDQGAWENASEPLGVTGEGAGSTHGAPMTDEERLLDAEGQAR